MDRRDVLKFGALAGVGGSGCASLLSNPSALGAADMNGFLATLDSALENILPGRPFDAFFPTQNHPELAARARKGEDLTRKTLRSLLLVGTVGELPPEQVRHEGVQQRLRGSMGEFDDAVFGMVDVLEGLGPTERADVSQALRDDPGLGMRIMGTFDQEAAAMGISLKQRTKLRSISAQACARLRQSPELAISEYTGKVRKIAARHGARSEGERRAAAAIGNALLWQQGEELETGAFRPVTGGSLPESPDAGVPELPDAGWTPPPMLAGPDAPRSPTCATSKECLPSEICGNYRDLGNGKWSRGQCVAKPKKEKFSGGILTAGGVIFGLGAVGAVVVLGAGGGVVAATVGAIMGVLALLVVIVGLIVLATGH